MKGTIRINARNLRPYLVTKKGASLLKVDLPKTFAVIKLFAAHDNLRFLVGKDNYLKGSLVNGKPKGARITVLPDGQLVDKAYSLFAKDLTVHDESSDDHWDVLFQNPGGTYAYVYTLAKIERHRKKKYRAVHDFEKYYPVLKRKVARALRDDDYLALPMYTLLKTYMRVGNEVYYKAHGNKGLTTLKKSDIKIIAERVRFDYLSKGGVPRTIVKSFPESYVRQLSKRLRRLPRSSFVFTNPDGRPLSDLEFKEAFRKYCGREFYPHIVRSFYATKKAKEFLRQNKKPKKSDIRALFTEIAHELGHKKIDPKTHNWVDSYNITVNYYIQPEIVDKLKSFQ